MDVTRSQACATLYLLMRFSFGATSVSAPTGRVAQKWRESQCKASFEEKFAGSPFPSVPWEGDNGWWRWIASFGFAITSEEEDRWMRWFPSACFEDKWMNIGRLKVVLCGEKYSRQVKNSEAFVLFPNSDWMVPGWPTEENLNEQYHLHLCFNRSFAAFGIRLYCRRVNLCFSLSRF